jgi:hypothetical protein
MTAYSGQLTGETYRGKLASQVESLNSRPAAVIAMTVFHLVFALFPLVLFAHYLPGPASTNPDDAYQSSMSSAFHIASAAIAGFVLIPLSAALVFLAWATFVQRTWTYNAAFAPLIVFVIVMITKFKHPSTLVHVAAVFSIIGVFALVFFWYRPATRAWFGL